MLGTPLSLVAALGGAERGGTYLALQGLNLPRLRAILEPPALTWRVALAIVWCMVTGIRWLATSHMGGE